jgi:acetyltransferase-like isoleucine patch superfamily enzyme
MALKTLRIWLGLKKNPADIPRDATVGRRTYGVSGHSFMNCSPQSPVTIGAFCSIAREVLFLCQANHPTHTASTFPLQSQVFKRRKDLEYLVSKGPIRVGNDVWIGARAIILSGVSIGDGAVIAAGSVVTRDVPPYTIAAGNPARVIRPRYDSQTVEALLAIRWWDWPDAKIRAEKDAFDLPANEFAATYKHVEETAATG